MSNHRMRESEIVVAITDCELIVTEKMWRGAQSMGILNVGDNVPMDVLAWINHLRRDDPEAMGMR